MNSSSAAEEIGQSLLQSMDAEDPFKLLRSLPGRLSDLLTADAQRDGSQVSFIIFRFQVTLFILRIVYYTSFPEPKRVTSLLWTPVSTCQMERSCN